MSIVAICDYDFRTPLHLAAANGHDHVVRYLLAHGASPAAADRFGYKPEQDAARGGHRGCVHLLAAAAADAV